MKYSIFSLYLALSLLVGPSGALALTINGDGDAIITAGEAVHLNWDSQNVINRAGSNDYGDTFWYPGQPPLADKIEYAANYFMNPGIYRFRYDFEDDDSPFAPYYDNAWLTVLPQAPSSTNAPVCNGAGDTATLSWNLASAPQGGTSARVVVNRAGGLTCPGGWTQQSPTSCERNAGPSNISFPVTTGTTYTSWQVYSRAGAGLMSIGAASGGSFSCTAGPSVQLNFR